MDAIIGRGKFDRERGSFPPWQQVNMLLEEAKTDPTGYNLLTRPPMVEYGNWGAGPVHGVFQRDGLFSGSTFAVSGGNLYKDGVLLGAINGTGPVVWAGGNNELVVTRGQTAYSWNGTNLAAIAFPDGADVRSVNWMARRFIFVRKGSGRFYWSELDDARTVGGLNFANAESEPDELFDIKKTGDVFWMFGTSSGEAWALTGDSLLPWSRISQRNLNVGVRDTGCAEEMDNSVYFVGNDNRVYRIADVAQRVSDAGLEEKLANSAGCLCFQWQYQSKLIFSIRLDSGSFALDVSLQSQPIEFQTQGRSQWAAKCATTIDGMPLFGDDTAGSIWEFDPTATTDCGETEMPRIFSAGLPINTKPGIISNVLVDGDSGSTPAETGEAADPILEMRLSRDAGRTFGNWRATRWGAKGEYKRQARFGPAGAYSPPGWLAEFRMLACAPLRVAKVRVNEPLSGRGI